jgi:4-aminobutyrate aminotransferase-like enzyme/Ser/Thr protein kinase RdoA (MazF antagonist)
VLTTDVPRFSDDHLGELLSESYGVAGGIIAPLDSERDQVVLFGDDHRQIIAKVSNTSESASNIELEEAAALWAAAADPELPISCPLPVSPTGARYAVVHDRTGAPHFLRAYDRLPGAASLDGATLSDATVEAYGTVTARTARALRGFFHPALGRRLPWHVEERARTRQLVVCIEDAATRDLVDGAFDGFEERVAPTWATLRAQAVHSDLTLDNLLVDDGEITGVLDLGDLTHATLVSDIAAAFGSLSSTLAGDDLFRTLRLFLDGYRSVDALEPSELAVLGDAVALRAAITLCISAWRQAEHPENANYIAGWDGIALSLLRQFRELGHEEVTRRLGGPVPPPDATGLRRRRRAAFGDALAPLTYAEPLYPVRGSGATLTDSAGTTYVDAYNNVPVVGHAHPRVSGAVADQSRLLSTNLRYLHPRAIELVERLVETMPPGIDTVLLVNSGSEATDMAWRLATTVTGRTGALVTDFAYHGVTAASAAFSPEEWREGPRPAHVERFAAPRGARADAESLREAIGRLGKAGHEPAMVIVDPAYTSDGILTPGPSYHEAIAATARAAGALVVADEVQAGYARSGDHLWSCVGAGLVPDILTLGKPMGNGYPLAAVATRRSHVEALARQAEFFSTFAGSPVAAVAGLAVLDVIADRDLVGRTGALGERLRRRLREATSGCAAVKEIRGRGLLIGVDLAGTPTSTVAAVADRAKELGVLVGTTGAQYDVLKIRPPLVITEREIDRVAEVVSAAVMQIADC